MLLERKSLLSGNVHVMDINVTPALLAAGKGGVLVQTAMPTLSPDTREFILSGLTPKEWEELLS